MSVRTSLLILFAILPFSAQAHAAEQGESRLAQPYHQLARDLNKFTLRLNGHGARLPTPEEMARQLTRWPDVPPRENAAFLYVEALQHLAWSEDFPAERDSKRKPFFGDIEPLRAHVALNAKAIAVVKRATELPQCHFPMLVEVTDDGWRWSLYYYTYMNQLARVVRDAAFVLEIDDNVDEAAELYLAGIRIDFHRQTHPNDNSLGLELLGGRAFGGLQQLMANQALSDATLHRIVETASQCELTSSALAEVSRMWHDDERARVSASGFAKFKSFWETFSPDRTLPESEKQFRAQLDRLHQNTLGVIELPPWVSLRDHSRLNSLLTEGLPEGSFVSFYADEVPYDISSLARSKAYMRSLQLRAALDLYARTNGKPPTALNKLAPVYLRKLPLDPFSGEHFIYQPLGRTWRFYSVYVDLRDNRGRIPGLHNVRGMDLVFKQRLPTSRRGRMPHSYDEDLIPAYTTAIGSRPRDPDLRYHRARVYARKGKWRMAIQDFSRAIELNPRDVGAHFGRAEAHYDADEFTQAIRDYTRVIQLDPYYWDLSWRNAYTARAWAYHWNDEHAKASADIATAERLGYWVDPDLRDKVKKARQERN